MPVANALSPMIDDYAPQTASDPLNQVLMTNISGLIRVGEYKSIAGFQSYCAELQKDLQLLSEVLICIHFCHPKHPLTPALLSGLREIMLHRYTIQAVR